MVGSRSSNIQDVTEQGLDAVEDKVLEGLEVTRDAAQKAAEQGAEIQDKTQKIVKDISNEISAYVQEKPLQAAGIAFAAGVVATLFLSRR